VYSAPVVYSSVPLYSPTPYFQTSSNVGGSNYGSGRRKRNLQENSDSGEEFFSDESAEELRLEIEAAEINGHAYLYMAAQFCSVKSTRNPKKISLKTKNYCRTILGT
jgi:hypothetical protein